MKPFLPIFIFFCTLFPHRALAEDPVKPTATITSEDLYFCESGDVVLNVKFTGTPPFSFQYKSGGATSTSPSTSEYEFSFPFSNISEDTSFELVKVYDANYLPTGDTDDGSTEVSGIINVYIDTKPTVDAGEDQALCGYEYTMEGSVTGTSTKVWWSDPGSEATFEDSSSPTSTLSVSTPNTYTLRLNAENGACTDDFYDEVEVTLYGRPQGSFSELSDWKYCSSDAPSHAMPLTLKFDGYGDFDYTLKNNTGTVKGAFTTSESEVNITIPVTDTETISFQSIEDSNGCQAELTDMIGERTAIDVKPDTDAGSDQITPPNCGSTFTLEAKNNDGATGIWETLDSDIIFSDETQANAIVTANLNTDELEKTVSLTWTETVITSDGLECIDSDEVSIKFIQPPTLTINSVTDSDICENESATIDFSLNGSTPCDIIYNIGSTSHTTSVASNSPELTFMYPELALEDNTIYFTQIKDNYDCITDLSLSQDIWVDEMPVANAGPDTDTCGLTIDLQATAQYEQSEWLFSEGTFKDRTEPTTQFTANNAGELSLIWKETNGRCTDTDTVNINFYEAPYPVKEITDTVIYAANYIVLPADSLKVGTGQWSIIEPEVSAATFEDYTLYRSKFYNFDTDENYHLQWKASLASAPEACRERIHNVYIKTNSLFAPTGISPNNDGANDVLKIMGAENIPNNKLSVFDKHGKLIISIPNYGEWDQDKGEYKRWPNKAFGYKIPKPGIYLYVFEGDGISTIKNYITIKY